MLYSHANQWDQILCILSEREEESSKQGLLFLASFDESQYYFNDGKGIDRAIKALILVCRKAINPDAVEKGSTLPSSSDSTKAYKIEVSSRGKTKATKVDNTLRSEWKKHLATLFLLGTITEKFYNQLTKLTYGTLLNTMEEDIRHALYRKLSSIKKELSEEKDAEECASLSSLLSILKRTDSNAIKNESAVEDPEFYASSKVIEQPAKPMTILEILAAKRNGESLSSPSPTPSSSSSESESSEESEDLIGKHKMIPSDDSDLLDEENEEEDSDLIEGEDDDLL